MAPVRNTMIITVRSLLQKLFLSPLPLTFLHLLPTVVPTIVIILSIASVSKDYIFNRHLRNEEVEVFDFIVIGGGSAGSVVANRLSTIYNVLLLEGGGNPHLLSSIPTVSLITLNAPFIDYGYKTVPQENACFALKNNVSQWPRGKALGGSSIQNIMIYMRGNPADYDYWAAVTKNSEWSYENLLPYFKKFEDYNGHFPNTEIHGTGGPVHIEKLRFAPCGDYWLQAGKEIGYPIQDPNSFQKQGFSPMDVFMKKGSRFSTYRAYLKPILQRSSLTIYRYSQAVKIHLDRQRRAYGVTYYRHGQFKFVRANKEIIVSAGAVDSPRLLLLSGIGPKEHLHSLGMKCRVNLPVGQNLQDHVFTNVGPFTLTKSVSYIMDRDTNLQSVTDYLFNGIGPLVTIAGINGNAFYSTSLLPEHEKNWPDILLFGIGVGVHKSFGKESDDAFGLRPGTLESFYGPSEGKDANFISVNLGRPKSVGEIKLKSANPFEYPLIDPKYFSHQDDIEAMVEGVKLAVRIYENSTVYKKLGAHLALNKFPGCEQFELKSDDYWRCYVQHLTLTDYHHCGTCRMGSGLEDKDAVVDSHLRVLKTTGLRVVDASIIPNITNANLNAPCIMIGEKGADLILSYWTSQMEVSDRLQEFISPDEDKCFYMIK